MAHREITLSLNDGVRRDVLESITHGRKEQQSIDLYNSPLWTLKCEELAKLKVRMSSSEVEIEEAEVEARAVAGAQKASGPVELTGPLAAGGAQVFEMIRYREAPTTGLEPVAR